MKTNIINTPNMNKAKVRNSEATFFMSGATQDNKEIASLLANKKYYIHTYGCQANVRDEETMRGLLENVNMLRTENPIRVLGQN